MALLRTLNLILLCITISGIPIRAYSQLTPQDQAAMTGYLETLSTAWDQPSVDAANNIVSKPTYNASNWMSYFANYFATHQLSASLFNYLNYPTFWWFDDDTHYKLQFSLSQVAKTKISSLLQGHPTDLGSVLDTSAPARDDFISWLRLMWNVGVHAASGIDKQVNFEWLKQLIATNAPLLQTTAYIDPNAQPYVNYIRMQVRIALRDALPLSPAVKTDISTTLMLSGVQRQLWSDHSILVHDNQFLRPTDYLFLQAFWGNVPPRLSLPDNLAVNEALGNDAGRSVPVSALNVINIFALHARDRYENGFPSDVGAFNSDLFALVAIHETNHVVDAGYIQNDAALRARRDLLISDAGNDRQNYLRSILPDGFFTGAPQEFFASMSNMYVANTERTFEVGRARWQAGGRRQPIEQFLFFVDVYSQQGTRSKGYVVNTDANLTAYDIPLQRDSNGRIVSFTLPSGTYKVAYAADGHVRSLEVASSRRRAVRH